MRAGVAALPGVLSLRHGPPTAALISSPSPTLRDVPGRRKSWHFEGEYVRPSRPEWRSGAHSGKGADGVLSVPAAPEGSAWIMDCPALPRLILRLPVDQASPASIALALDLENAFGCTALLMHEEEGDALRGDLFPVLTDAMACVKRAVPILVQDRVDVALACDAQGVHVSGANGLLPLASIKRLLSATGACLLSSRAGSPREAAAAVREGAAFVTLVRPAGC